MRPNRIFITIFLLFLLSSTHKSISQTEGDSVYFKNFVRHSDRSSCQHEPPEATFTVYLNNDQNTILLENAPRWESGAESNIPGNGTFGVELANFNNPKITVGDTVSIRFTCNITQEQGILTNTITNIPWNYFPSYLDLVSTSLPTPPQNLSLSLDSTNFNRVLSWSEEQDMKYDIYRRDYSDTLSNGKPRMLYARIARNLSTENFTDTTTTEHEKYGYVVYSISQQGIRSSHSSEVNEDPYIKPGMDLTIGYIARLPRIDYVWNSSNPEREGWPDEGQTITWKAVIKNWSDSTLDRVPYKWVLNDSVVDTGYVAMPPEDTASVKYDWDWTFERRTLKFVIDHSNVIHEEEEENNTQMIFTDAISVGFYVEQDVYKYFHDYQKELGVHSNCWEDWAYRHVRIWNKMFANAIYPDSPNGVVDRIRIDKITIVPNNALPLAGGLASNHPNKNDRSVDLQWGFPATLLDGDFYKNHTSKLKTNPFYFEGSLLHELGHARYLIDLYGFNVHDNGSGESIAIKKNDQLIVGTDYMPMISGNIVYSAKYKGLMNSQFTYVDEYSTVALNLIAGHRAIMGNYNAPRNIGVFLQDLPVQNRLHLKAQDGHVLSNAKVEIYQAESQPGVWYGKYYDDFPDLELTANSTGTVLLSRCPFSGDGKIHHTYGISNAVIIIRVEKNDKVGYGFLEATDFNMEYWRGNTEVGNYSLEIEMIAPTHIADKKTKVPNQFAMLQNYPNPFNGKTSITYSIPEKCYVELIIYNLAGKQVRTLVSENKTKGNYCVVWNGTNDLNQQVSSGIYVYKLKSSANKIMTKKMLYLK